MTSDNDASYGKLLSSPDPEIDPRKSCKLHLEFQEGEWGVVPYPDGNGSTDFEPADRGLTVPLKSMTVTDGKHCTWNIYGQIDCTSNT